MSGERIVLPGDWDVKLGEETAKPYFQQLQEFVRTERATQTIFPSEENTFAALANTPYHEVKVLLLGQDPYHGEGQAHGLCFSVLPGVKTPPSLVNIYKELKTDLGYPVPNNGYLLPWAQQGILMLNTVLTVRKDMANSHKGRGWETFTDAVIKCVNEKDTPVIFVLWGSPAQKKTSLIDTARHHIVASPHPSPLSASTGFFGSKPFTKINALLAASNQNQIEWQIPSI